MFGWYFFFFLLGGIRVNSFYFQVRTPLLKINKMNVFNSTFVLFKPDSNWKWLPDECPHMGASLANGKVNQSKIICPYHGFGFVGNENNLLQIGNDVFFSLDQESPWPYYPPEHFDKDFVATNGHVTISKNQQIVTENVLDMVHISYVHSFGKKGELPQKISFEPLSNFSGRTTFFYTPFEWTISQKVGNVKKVIVENEYHLPSTTITRVKAGKLIKTVVTRATPISPYKTSFFYKVYRNFWKSDNFPFLTIIGNRLMDFLMDRTINEDMEILSTVYDNRGKGKLTPYDVTIKRYRENLSRYNINTDCHDKGTQNKKGEEKNIEHN